MLTLAPGSGVGIDPKIIAKSVVIAAVSHGRPAKDAEKHLCQRVKREWLWEQPLHLDVCISLCLSDKATQSTKGCYLQS